MESPYSRLDYSSGGQIRLLVLEPAKTLTAPIVCALEPVYLNLSPRYEALSYTRGPPGKTHEIRLNDVSFIIRENVQAALRRLRYADQPRRLWIDAISINQTDKEERGEQLLLMHKIYSQAEKVCVWLGESTELSGVGMAKLSLGTLQITSKARARAFLAKWGDNIHPIYENGNKMAGRELEWGEVRELLARPWWSRVWAVQEAVLAKSLILICGPDSTPWESLENASKKQPTDVRAIQVFGIELNPSDPTAEDMFYAISNFREQRSLNRWNPSIYELLYQFRRLDCADPRGRIYAFLGLAANIIPSRKESISTAEMYTEFARTIIRDTGSLSILNCARKWRGGPMLEPPPCAYTVSNQSSYHDNLERVQVEHSPAASFDELGSTKNQTDSEMAYLPSWVPNWAGITQFDAEPLVDWSMTTPKYSTSASTPAEIGASAAPGDPLELLGFVFDDIFQLVDPWHPSPNEIPISRRGIAPLEQWETLALLSHPDCPYGGSSGRKEALWRTYIADSPGTDSTPSTRSPFV